MQKRTLIAILLIIFILALISPAVSAQDYSSPQGFLGTTASGGGPLTSIWGMLKGLFGPLFAIDLSNEVNAKLLIGILLFAILGTIISRLMKEQGRIGWVIAAIVSVIVSIATPAKVILAIAQTYAFAFVAIALGAVLVAFFVMHKQIKRFINPQENPRGYNMVAALYYALLLVIFQSMFGIFVMLFEGKAGPTWFLEIKSFMGMILTIMFFYHILKALFSGFGGAASRAAGGIGNLAGRIRGGGTTPNRGPGGPGRLGNIWRGRPSWLGGQGRRTPYLTTCPSCAGVNTGRASNCYHCGASLARPEQEETPETPETPEGEAPVEPGQQVAPEGEAETPEGETAAPEGEAETPEGEAPAQPVPTGLGPQPKTGPGTPFPYVTTCPKCGTKNDGQFSNCPKCNAHLPLVPQSEVLNPPEEFKPTEAAGADVSTRATEKFILDPVPSGGSEVDDAFVAEDVEARTEAKLAKQERRMIDLIHNLELVEMTDLKKMHEVMDNLAQIVEQMEQFGGTPEQITRIQSSFNNNIKNIETDMRINERKRAELIGSLGQMENQLAKHADREVELENIVNRSINAEIAEAVRDGASIKGQELKSIRAVKDKLFEGEWKEYENYCNRMLRDSLKQARRFSNEDKKFSAEIEELKAQLVLFSQQLVEGVHKGGKGAMGDVKKTMKNINNLIKNMSQEIISISSTEDKFRKKIDAIAITDVAKEKLIREKILPLVKQEEKALRDEKAKRGVQTQGEAEST